MKPASHSTASLKKAMEMLYDLSGFNDEESKTLDKVYDMIEAYVEQVESKPDTALALHRWLNSAITASRKPSDLHDARGTVFEAGRISAFRDVIKELDKNGLRPDTALADLQDLLRYIRMRKRRTKKYLSTKNHNDDRAKGHAQAYSTIETEVRKKIRAIESAPTKATEDAESKEEGKAE